MLRIAWDLAQRLDDVIRFAQGLGRLPDTHVPPIKVTHTSRPEFGDYSTAIAHQLAPAAKMEPQLIAEEIISQLPDVDYLAGVEQVGGFINFRLDDSWLQRQVDVVLEQAETFAQLDLYTGQRAQVECISANPTGPLTVARVRGGVLGDTIARLLRAVAYQVEMEYYYNDAGRQMRVLGESMRARYLERLGLPVAFPEEGYRGEYLCTLADGLIAEQDRSWADITDPTPFREYAEPRIMGMIRSTLKRINIAFDSFFNENWLYEDGSVWETLERLEEKGLTYKAVHPEKDPDADEAPDAEELEAAMTGPAVWLKTRALRGTKKDRALVKSGGEPTYRLPDIAYHINKLERGFDVIINVLGADHLEEYEDVRAAVGALGYDAEKIHVIIHQFVTLREGDVAKRMSTRRGEYVILDALIDDVGPDVVRFFMLARNPDSHINFDLDLARKQSDENPVYYIQNAHVRCAGIARVATERGVSKEGGNVALLTHPLELALIRKLVELPEIIEQAVDTLNPHILAHWAHTELAQVFHRTYEEVRALHRDVPADLARARLKLYAAAQIVIAEALHLMGMNAPDFM